MNRKTLSKSNIKDLNLKLEKYGVLFDKKTNLQYVQDSDLEGYLLDKDLIIFNREGTLIPTLKYILKSKINIPSVEIDIPAVKFMVKGADVMRPGITKLGEFEEGDIVVVRDEVNKKPVCLTKALKSSEELKNIDKGKVLENIHYVGDKIWNFVL